jgi:ClpP class serine protease
MPNAVMLAARLAGRPLLMRADAAEQYARQLLAVAPPRPPREGRSPIGALLDWARRDRRAAATTEAPAEERGRPSCYWPLWLDRTEGEPDGVGFGWLLSGSIAIVGIEGPLLDRGFYYESWSGEACWVHGYDTLAETFAEIETDDRVKGVFVHYDTPGGMASSGLPELADQIRALGQTKPVWAFCDMAASAGYWLASASTRALAPRFGDVGSIGAVATHCDMSGALAQEGFKVTHIQFGKRKTDGSPYKPLSDTARADWQAQIDELGQIFVAGVVANRPGLTEDAVLATEAACYLAEHSDPARSGLAIGLVDEIASEQAAFAALQTLVSPAEEDPMSTNTARQTAIEGARARTAAATQTADATAETQTEAEAGDPADGGTEGDGSDTEADDTAAGGDTDASAARTETTAAAAIAASAEAKTHPNLALAAISSGMTVDQFKAAVAAAPASPQKQSRLDQAMAGAPRLGADAAAAGGDAERSGFSTAISARTQANRDKGKA